MSGPGIESPAKNPSEQALLYRRWLMSAALATAESDGLHTITVARVIAAARISRKVFYDCFSDVEDCLHAALEQVIANASEVIADARAPHESWRDGTRAALQTLFALAEQRRGLARLCIVEMHAGGPRLLALRGRTIEQASAAIARGECQEGARSP